MRYYSAIFAIGRQCSARFIAAQSTSTSTPASIQQRRTIYSKHAVPSYINEMPPPWPYKEKGYKMHHQMTDFTSKHLGENSKVIVVEGNIGSGKSQFAKELADQLGFYHIPEPRMSDMLVDSYGVDRKLYYHLYPETCRFFDERMFYEEPNHRNVARFQKNMLQNRVEQTCNAMAHVLNTGQGVVMEKFFRSDRVYMEAMHQKGYLSDAFKEHYYKLVDLVDYVTWLEPHVIIYLDCPVSRCLENIKNRHQPWEANSPAMDYSYLELIEKELRKFLQEFNRYAEVVTYDWSNGGDVSAVVEDLQRIELDEYDDYKSERTESWYLLPDAPSWNLYRHRCTSNKNYFLECFYPQAPQVEELYIPMADFRNFLILRDMIHGKYQVGYRTEMGDSVWEMMKTVFQPQPGKNWIEYSMKDDFMDDVNLGMNMRSDPVPTTFPASMLQPRSPYKSDGGCMADAHLIRGAHGHHH